MNASSRTLITAASAHGATLDIARAIRDTLGDHDIPADLIPPGEVPSLTGYHEVILGSAVYYGHWMTPARDFAARFRTQLATRQVWLFSSGPVGDPARKTVQSMAQDPVDVTRLLNDIHPRDHRMFAGRLDPRQTHGTQRVFASLFRGFQGDFRDWQQIRSWAEEIAADLTARHGVP